MDQLRDAMSLLIRKMDEADVQSGALKELQKEIDGMKESVMEDLLARVGPNSSVTHGGRKFSVKIDTCVSVLKENRAEVLRLASEQGLDLLQISVPTLQSYLRGEARETGREVGEGTVFESLIGTFRKGVLGITRA